MSRARLHELRALKRRILRAEAGGTPDLASRRAFNAELRASRLALRAGGEEDELQGKLKINPALYGLESVNWGKNIKDKIVMEEVDLKHDEIVAVRKEHESRITVENLQKALNDAHSDHTKRMELFTREFDKDYDYYLKANLSKNLSKKQRDNLNLSQGLRKKHIDGHYVYEINITNSKCFVDIRFSILCRLKRDIEQKYKDVNKKNVKLPKLSKGWGLPVNFKTRTTEINKFLKALNQQMKENERIRSEVIDTIVQHTCKISLGGCPLGGDMVTFMYDDQSTTSEGPVVVTLKEHKIKILASAGELREIQKHELKGKKIKEDEAVYGKIIKDGEILKVVDIGNGDKLPLYRARKLKAQPESAVILGSPIQNPDTQISLFKRNEPYFAYDVKNERYSKQIQYKAEAVCQW